MSVKVIEKNAGEKIPYTEKGYNLCFGDMLTIKCNKYQKDWPVVLIETLWNVKVQKSQMNFMTA